MANINDLLEQLRNAETMWDVWALEEVIDAKITEQVEIGQFPHFGYTTTQTFESAEAWETWKRGEVAEAVAEAKTRLNMTVEEWRE